MWIWNGFFCAMLIRMSDFTCFCIIVDLQAYFLRVSKFYIFNETRQQQSWGKSIELFFSAHMLLVFFLKRIKVTWNEWATHTRKSETSVNRFQFFGFPIFSFLCEAVRGWQMEHRERDREAKAHREYYIVNLLVVYCSIKRVHALLPHRTAIPYNRFLCFVFVYFNFNCMSPILFSSHSIFFVFKFL